MFCPIYCHLLLPVHALGHALHLRSTDPSPPAVAVQGFRISEESFPATLRYMAYIQLLPEWKCVDYGAAAIIKGWEKHGATVRTPP